MEAKDKERFAVVIAALASSFGREADDAMMTGYSFGLGDLPIADIEKAVARAIRECKFCPSAYELRGLAGEITPAVRAALAWTEFERAASRVGAYKSVDFGDRLINATLFNLGGWVKCCETLTESREGAFFRKEFERVYQGLLTNAPPASWLSPLLGIAARENAGMTVPKHLEGACGLIPVVVATELPKLPYVEQARAKIKQRAVANLPAPSGEPKQIGELFSNAAQRQEG